MIVALFLLAALVIVGVVLKIEHNIHLRRNPEPEREIEPESEECCGLHITCERDSLLAGVSDKIEYYDDEELDRHIGREADSYTDAEIEEFRDILLTLRTEEIAGWARSLHVRNVALPTCVKEELIMIVSEARSTSVA